MKGILLSTQFIFCIKLLLNHQTNGGLAQSEEHSVRNVEAPGSKPGFSISLCIRMCAWMIFVGTVCRLQICRCLTAQWFDSTFCAILYSFVFAIGGVEKHLVKNKKLIYLHLHLLYCAYLLTALFASVSACLDSSPGNTNLHAA